MVSTETPNTHQKALAIKLDPTSCSLLAEISVSQEVLRWFLVVSETSRIVAKSISAYAKEVSNDLYEPSSAISRCEFVVPHLPIAAAARTPHVNREAV